jgi:hypothetical protein
MRLGKAFLLKNIWQVKGQLRRYRTDQPKSFGDVQVAAYKNGARTSVSLSADFELCWAWRALPAAECERRATVERANVPFLVSLLEAAEVPVTWATVGHLFLEQCTRKAGDLAHVQMRRPRSNSEWRGDWYRHDPCLNSASAPGWYAPDLIRIIQGSKVAHEIGTHSFSHIDFSQAGTDELVRNEIEACIEAMAPFGVRPKSLVFCFNRMGYQHLDALYQMGIVAVRHRDRRIRLAHPERTPCGIYKLYESMNLRLSRKYDYVDKAKVFIDEAIRRGTSYHLWFHPSDERQVFVEAFLPIIEYLVSARRANQIWIATMGDLASYREARNQMRIRVEKRAAYNTLYLDCPIDHQKFGDPEVTLVISTQIAPRSVTIKSSSTSSKPSPAEFRFDQERRTVTLNVRSSDSEVRIEHHIATGMERQSMDYRHQDLASAPTL